MIKEITRKKTKKKEITTNTFLLSRTANMEIKCIRTIEVRVLCPWVLAVYLWLRCIPTAQSDVLESDSNIHCLSDTIVQAPWSFFPRIHCVNPSESHVLAYNFPFMFCGELRPLASFPSLLDAWKLHSVTLDLLWMVLGILSRLWAGLEFPSCVWVL